MRTNRRKAKSRKQKWEEKQLYIYFKWQIHEISREKIWTWLRKGNLSRETEYILKAAENAIRTNYIKTQIDNMQQNSLCSLCGDSDETINNIVSKCSKRAQKKYKD